jgi:hypothetical protein
VALIGIAGARANTTQESNGVDLQIDQLLAGATVGDTLTNTAINNSPGAFWR